MAVWCGVVVSMVRCSVVWCGDAALRPAIGVRSSGVEVLGGWFLSVVFAVPGGGNAVVWCNAGGGYGVRRFLVGVHWRL